LDACIQEDGSYTIRDCNTEKMVSEIYVGKKILKMEEKHSSWRIFLLKIAARNAKYRNAKNSISGYIPILVSP